MNRPTNYFEFQDWEASEARREKRIERRRKFSDSEPPTMNAKDKIDELRAILTDRIDFFGNYKPRKPGDTASDLLCEILGLVTDGEMGNNWIGSKPDPD